MIRSNLSRECGIASEVLNGGGLQNALTDKKTGNADEHDVFITYKYNSTDN